MDLHVLFNLSGYVSVPAYRIQALDDLSTFAQYDSLSQYFNSFLFSNRPDTWNGPSAYSSDIEIWKFALEFTGM